MMCMHKKIQHNWERHEILVIKVILPPNKTNTFRKYSSMYFAKYNRLSRCWNRNHLFLSPFSLLTNYLISFGNPFLSLLLFVQNIRLALTIDDVIKQFDGDFISIHFQSLADSELTLRRSSIRHDPPRSHIRIRWADRQRVVLNGADLKTDLRFQDAFHFSVVVIVVFAETKADGERVRWRTVFAHVHGWMDSAIVVHSLFYILQ